MTAAPGTTPPGASTEREAAEWVRRMFAAIAPRYDFINHLLSFNIDRLWRRDLRKSLAPVLGRPTAKVLDLCCGTGDVLLAFEARASAFVFGADFCHEMLASAQRKALSARRPALLFEADALQLPIADSSLDAVSIAFGFRNLANYESGLRELYRVLKPGGRLAILEFSHPRGLVRAAYTLYSRLVLPAVGSLLSGSRNAYAYLPVSIDRFPRAPELRDRMNAAGFATEFRLLTGGIAALHTATKSCASQ
ncbi:MAG: bifunctional demethylmenaquinone methyltransferase/2-methoxy-6-polyprenyl-1,4-benzoquinol methylase UbiE [Acidobacteriaceae bacterium]|nr:bifunctional demethylmenaquinone methyltransferase/2-methoxy-6-polyprenyl-1,4-benzoquinol methylase UbiE [Acidobacteriaceae bacterium]